jgi:hypothetical protein
MEKLNVIDEIGAYIENINFSNKAIYISHKYRIIFQVSRIVLIIGIASRISGCSLLKLQFLSSALDDIELFDRIEKHIVGGGFSENLMGYWRYNKNVNNAVKYAIAEKLITTSSSGLFILTNGGVKMLESLNKEMVMMEDKKQLCRISKKLSERKLSDMFGKGIRI